MIGIREVTLAVSMGDGQVSGLGLMGRLGDPFLRMTDGESC